MITDAKVKELTLSNIADGAAEELFRTALAEIARNIDDPNAPHTGKRRLTLHFDFTSNEERELGSVTISSKVSLQPLKGVQTNVYYGHDQGRMKIIEAPMQRALFPPGEGPVLVVQTTEG